MAARVLWTFLCDKNNYFNEITQAFQPAVLIQVFVKSTNAVKHIDLLNDFAFFEKEKLM